MTTRADVGKTESAQPGQPSLASELGAEGEAPSHILRYRVDKVLGQGGFGKVYLAYDEQLQRPVAIKVPHRHRVATSQDADFYLAEARAVANLDHPNIVPVHDVGSSPEYPCFIVSKFIDGMDLASALRLGRFSVRDTAELIAALAEALHHAHKSGLVHRDIKPANILLDSSHRPYLVDFGLALREQDLGKGPCYAGTPAYMSPEQARGEGHRVDGRSDIFSLGIVFYTLLVGRRPFQAESQEELLEQITTMEARPPRQWDDAIPREVERICLKALSKRASERYATAKDMADDLWHFLQLSRADTPLRPGREISEPVTLPRMAGLPPSSSHTQPIHILPKGLRSFDAADADFFLELLPGPRDRNRLPESIRFWKGRIESRNPDDTFAVGLLYGPSGCGKSSLVKAGLLPRLEQLVTVVYVEASPDETEARLLKGLRRQIPDLPGELTLVESLAALRRGRYLAAGQKVLLVLDQLEQWLHVRRREKNPALVQALRHCDGARLQSLLLVRDDFWLAVSRFMQSLEVEIREGHNSALVDLFDPAHARKVLTAFGRAYGRLPENPRQHTGEQDAFLDQAIASLSQEDKVISVRLALFAEMIKGKPWAPSTLKQVGGTEGVGAAFLEETFAASTAPPQHRLHQQAAQQVLKALLPQGRANIKGHMRSQRELLEVSGYVARPHDFADLVRILDHELRLITPADPEGSPDAGAATAPDRESCYQLTHDYLVPALRDWLSRKQRETRRGRAQHRLAERVELWQARSEARQLPSLMEWLEIRLLTGPTGWTAPEKQMMKAATRKHLAVAVRVGVILSLLASLAWLLYLWEANDRAAARASDIAGHLLESKLSQAPSIIAELDRYRHWTDPLLRTVASDPNAPADQRLRARLALLPKDPGQADPLSEDLLAADAQDFPVLRDALAPYAAGYTDRLWDLLEKPAEDPQRRFRAAAALAFYDPASSRWQRAARWVAAVLVKQPSLELPLWVDGLRPVRGHLTATLASLFQGRPTRETAAVLADYAADQPDVLADAVAHARPGTFPVFFAALARREDHGIAALTAALDRHARPEPGLSSSSAASRANLAIALFQLGQGQHLWPLLKASPDPRCRSFLIDRLLPLGSPHNLLLDQLRAEPDDTIRAAILLGLGHSDEDTLPDERRHEMIPEIIRLHQQEGSPAVHSAAEWLLRKWDQKPAAPKEEGRSEVRKRGWYVNRSGYTMVAIGGPVSFLMGAMPGESGAVEAERQHRVEIPHSYDIGMTEVTRGQYLRYLKDHPKRDRSGLLANPAKRPLDVPITSVSWYDAAAYCNWLSESEGLPRDQWCYEPGPDGSFAEGMKIVAGWESRSGYRLPTEVEWEYACRGGAASRWCHGDAEELLPKYAWYAANAEETLHPVGRLLPNAFGLFDMHGNVGEWCQDLSRRYGDQAEDRGPAIVWSKDYRVVRGGHIFCYARSVRSAKRFADRPPLLDAGGFRLARSRP